MTNKLYKLIKENISIILMAVLILLTFIEFPYYINAPGGIINLDKKVIVDDEYKSKGSFNIAYVAEYKANIYTLLYAYLNPNFDIIPKSEYLATGDTYESMDYREDLELDESIDNAIICAYKYANEDINITKEDVYITYVYNEANTDLKVGDKVVSIENIDITGRSKLKEVINNYNVGDRLNVKVINKDKEYDRYAYVIDVSGYKLIGIYTTTDKEYTISRNTKIKSKRNESGPSGGLMFALEIYNSLKKDDITKGKKIVGTGTILDDGTVGPIGGASYKLKSAVRSHADIFFVPEDNYEEVVNLKNEKGYKIEVVSVNSFTDALEYLKNI